MKRIRFISLPRLLLYLALLLPALLAGAGRTGGSVGRGRKRRNSRRAAKG